MADAEREKYDNMPDGLKEGERGAKMDEDASTLQEAADYCEDFDTTSALELLEAMVES